MKQLRSGGVRPGFRLDQDERSGEGAGIRRGDCDRGGSRSDATWEGEHPFGAASRGHCLSRQEDYVIFSAGHVNTDQRGAFGGALPNWTLPALETPTVCLKIPAPAVAWTGHPSDTLVGYNEG